MALRADDVDIVRDRDLVDRFQTGEIDAFEDLYTRYYDRVKRLCIRRVGDAHDAEEIAQEAFARAYVAFPNLGGPRHAYAWLSVVASRLCVDTHRRRARTQPTEQPERGEVVLDDDRLETEVDLGHLRAALERLTPRHREVLAFREQHEWSYQQIADHYGVSLGTVEALIFRARQALRREFAAVAGGPRKLAGVPVIGAVMRKLGTLREKIEPWIPSLSQMPYAELTTIAALVTTVGLTIGPLAGPRPEQPTTTITANAGDTRGLHDLDVPEVGDGPSTAAHTTLHAPPPEPAPAGAPSTELVQPETMDFDAARRNAEDQPTHASTDQFAVGANTEEFVRETASAGHTYAGQIEDWARKVTEGSLP